MSKTLFTAILVGAISGAVSATVVSMLVSPSSNGRAAQAGSNGSGIGQEVGADSLASLVKLQSENQALELRIANLEARPNVSSNRSPVDSGEWDGEVIQIANGETPNSVARFVDSGGGVSQAYYDDFRAASDMYDDEKRKTRDEERRVEREKRAEERLVALSEKLGLDEYQTDRVRGILASQDEQRGAAWEAMRVDDGNGQTREEIRAGMKLIEEQANSAMEAVLTPVQYESYQTTNRRGGGRTTGGTTGGGGRGNRGR
ncbi:MAG: hypothetical protein ACI9F9_002661 [Candidatus Paceibacteria bacterium]